MVHAYPQRPLPLCTDVLSQQIDWLRYTEREIFRDSNDYDEQFRKPKNREGNEIKEREREGERERLIL
jgi:hypothetical protein